jgi:arylsulfatase
VLGPACGDASRGQPDLIVVSIDTLRPDALGAYGDASARTPHIDALAEAGVRFDQATTPFPRTTPALATLMTGLWPQHHGSREVWDPVQQGTFLAELLHERGYFAVGVSGNAAASAHQGFARGFDRFLSRALPKQKRAGAVSRRSLALVREAPADRPLFLWVHYLDPHFPYEAPQARADPTRGSRCRDLYPLDRGDTYANRDDKSARALEDCWELYRAEISYTDEAVGRLLAGLREAGRLDDAIVVLTSDHGEHMGESGIFYNHGPSVGDPSMRVPLIVMGPGITRGHVDRGIARLEDLAPTLLSLLGVPKGDWPQMDGVDLSARLLLDAPSEPVSQPALAYVESGSALKLRNFNAIVSGSKDERHCTNGPRFSLCHPEPGAPARLYDRSQDPELIHDVSAGHPAVVERLAALERRWAPERPRQRAVRSLDFKLVDIPVPEGGYRRELYDLRSDPRETVDVSASHPQELERLGAALDGWTATLPDYSPPARSDEDLEALRELGYVR